MEENKKEILRSLEELLWTTREGRGLQRLEYRKKGDDETVTIRYNTWYKKIDVTGDSGIAMIRDIMKIF